MPYGAKTLTEPTGTALDGEKRKFSSVTDSVIVKVSVLEEFIDNSGVGVYSVKVKVSLMFKSAGFKLIVCDSVIINESETLGFPPSSVSKIVRFSVMEG